MTNLDIEEIGREIDLLIRSCRVKINGNTIVTPTRTIGTTLTDTFELNESTRLINNKFKPFGEVYVRASLNELAEYMTNDDKGKKFSSKISNRTLQLKQAGALPYILFYVHDGNGNPLNRLLPTNIQNFIFDILWGTAGNSIIVTPLLGVLTSPDEYSNMIDAIHQRQIDAIDRKNQPLMAIVPSSYTLIDPGLIEKYWNCGIRIFGFNCENKKYGAYSYIIEKLHSELSKLSRESKEKYIINGINSKFKYGKSKTSRINNLIGTGYGFDTYSPNHIVSRFFSENTPKRYVFNDSNYGFHNVTELEEVKDVDKLVNSNALKNIRLSELSSMPDSQLYKLCKAHDIEKTIKEIENYPSYIEDNELFDYLSTKEKIQTERDEMESIQHHQPIGGEWFI